MKLPSGWIFRARVVNKGTEIQVDQEELITCGECVYFKRDVATNVEGLPIPLIVAHEVCTKWGEGCRTSEDGYCFMAEKEETQ